MGCSEVVLTLTLVAPALTELRCKLNSARVAIQRRPKVRFARVAAAPASLPLNNAGSNLRKYMDSPCVASRVVHSRKTRESDCCNISGLIVASVDARALMTIRSQEPHNSGG